VVPPPGRRQGSGSSSETRDHGAICPTFFAAGGRTATVRGRAADGHGSRQRGLAFEATEIDFRSDYAACFENDIPFGGLFTGAEGIKTAAQQAIYGGTVGEQYDPCYHEACDTFANNNEVLDLNSDAIAFATLTYAMDTSSVNGSAAAA
jgi:hypothetical protein